MGVATIWSPMSFKLLKLQCQHFGPTLAGGIAMPPTSHLENFVVYLWLWL